MTKQPETAPAGQDSGGDPWSGIPLALPWLVLVLGGPAALIVALLPDGRKPPFIGGYAASCACNAFVRKAISTSATATFASGFSSDTRWRPLAHPPDFLRGKTAYLVESWVNADNEFGAKVRRRYKCIAVWSRQDLAWQNLGVEFHQWQSEP